MEIMLTFGRSRAAAARFSRSQRSPGLGYPLRHDTPRQADDRDNPPCVLNAP